MLVRQKGDTIIEVLLAVTVFSMVAIGALVAMNRGIATAQTALEITQTKQQIDSQAELLRAIHAAYINNPTSPSEWTTKLATNTSSADTSSNGIAGGCPNIPSDAFIINPRTIKPEVPKAMAAASYPYPGIWFDKNGNMVSNGGIWIEKKTKTADGFPNIREFIIKACWQTMGSSVPQTIDTIVRLYEHEVRP